MARQRHTYRPYHQDPDAGPCAYLPSIFFDVAHEFKQRGIASMWSVWNCFVQFVRRWRGEIFTGTSDGGQGPDLHDIVSIMTRPLSALNRHARLSFVLFFGYSGVPLLLQCFSVRILNSNELGETHNLHHTLRTSSARSALETFLPSREACGRRSKGLGLEKLANF